MDSTMTVSPFGLELVKAFEGYFAKPYRCPAGVLTQGYGHTAAAGAPALGGIWSKDYASHVLRETLERRYAAPVRKLLKREPSQAQFDAMVSLAYNIGFGAFARSSVLRCFNRGDDEGAASAFFAWNRGGGRVLPGLLRRRASEALVYQGIQDLDFDGTRDDSSAFASRASPGRGDKPVYGPMAQRVEHSDGPVEDGQEGEQERLVRHVQERLKALGYHEAGAVDGDFGSRTRGALLAFKADHELPLQADTVSSAMDDATLRALATGSARQVSETRAVVSAGDLRSQGSKTIAATDDTKAAAVATGVAGGGGVVLQIVNGLGTAKDKLSPVLDLVTTAAPWIAGIAIVGFAVVTWWSAHEAEKARVAAAREGRHN